MAKTLKCPKCQRTFSMAAHLGRHMAASHGGKGKVGRPPGRPGRPAYGRRAAGGGDGLLGSIQAARAELSSQQAQIAVQLAALDQLLGVLGGSAPVRAPKATGAMAPRRGRPRGGRAQAGSLRSYVEQVLRQSGRPMRVAEITEGVRQAGYPTRNKRLGHTVAKLLAAMPNAAKVQRGVFKAR